MQVTENKEECLSTLAEDNIDLLELLGIDPEEFLNNSRKVYSPERNYARGLQYLQDALSEI